MTHAIETRLNELGITLPDPVAPVGAYVAHAISGTTLYISGQISLDPELGLITGKVGDDLTVETGIAAARACAINILAQAKDAVHGDWDRLVRCLKLGGFVNAASDFPDHPKVLNGASDLMVAVMGDAGKHVRYAVGAGSLPLNIAVEVEALFEVHA